MKARPKSTPHISNLMSRLSLNFITDFILRHIYIIHRDHSMNHNGQVRLKLNYHIITGPLIKVMISESEV